MNSNDKILDVLLKISKSLDEIKERMGSAPCPAADKKKGGASRVHCFVRCAFGADRDS